MRVNRVVAGTLCLTLATSLAFAQKNRAKQASPPSPPITTEVTPPREDPRVVAPNLRASMVQPHSTWRRNPADILKAAEEDERNYRYRGTAITPNKKATGEDLAIQKRIAAQLGKMDFVPDVRRAHFQWMDEHPVKLVAWQGEIETINRTPAGIVVRVRFWPDAVPLQDKLMAHGDAFYENYRYANARAWRRS